MTNSTAAIYLGLHLHEVGTSRIVKISARKNSRKIKVTRKIIKIKQKSKKPGLHNGGYSLIPSTLL